MIKEPNIDATVTDGTTRITPLPDVSQQIVSSLQIAEAPGKIPERTPIGAEELARILAEHQLWLDDGEAGRRCDLSLRDLTGCDLELSDRSFKQAVLRGTNLSGLTLCQTDFSECDLTESDFHDAVLRGAGFRGAKGLLPEQFAGTDLRRAELPDDIKAFDALKNIEEMSKSNGKTLIGLLLGCIYTGVTLMTTTDVALLTNSGTSTLPFVSTTLPLNAFFLAAPLLILAGYIYLHLHLQRQWEAMSKLPAYFPDGHTLDEKVYPWMLNGFVRVHLPLLNQGRGDNGRVKFWHRLSSNRHRFIERAIYWSLTWAFVPFVLICAWGIYLPRRYWPCTVIHIALIALIVGAGVSYHRLAIATLKKEANQRLWRRRGWSWGWTVIFLGLFSWLSYGAINGVPPDPKARFLTSSYWTLDATRCVPWMFSFFNRLDWGAYQNLLDKDVSTKPANWTGESDNAGVKGALLQDLNLRYLRAQHAFLVNAHFERSRLNHAQFEYAFLQGAYFNTSGPYPNPVRLDDAVFYGADLRGAHFEGTKNVEIFGGLNGAFLERADFRKASLKGADFIGASLRGADLSGDDFNGVILDDTDLTKTNIASARFKGASLDGTMFDMGKPRSRGEQPNFSGADLGSVCFFGKCFRNVDMSRAHFCSEDSWPGLTLIGADMLEADLNGADLRFVDLSGAHLEGADLRWAKLQFADMSSVKFFRQEYSKAAKKVTVYQTNLSGADLSETIGLTRDQLKSAKMDNQTKKPIYYWRWVGEGKSRRLEPEKPNAGAYLRDCGIKAWHQEREQNLKQQKTKK